MLKYFRTLRTLCAATIPLLALLATPAAHASTVATFNVSGAWTTQSPSALAPGNNLFGVSGAFSGELFNLDAGAERDYRFAADIQVGSTPTSLISVLSDSVVIEDLALQDIETAAVSLFATLDPTEQAALEALATYVVGNSGTPFPISPTAAITFSYSGVEITETTIAGNFLFSLITSDPLSPLPNNASGFYAAALSISEVPLPASGLLLIGALGGIAVMRRKTD